MGRLFQIINNKPRNFTPIKINSMRKERLTSWTIVIVVFVFGFFLGANNPNKSNSNKKGVVDDYNYQTDEKNIRKKTPTISIQSPAIEKTSYFQKLLVSACRRNLNTNTEDGWIAPKDIPLKMSGKDFDINFL